MIAYQGAAQIGLASILANLADAQLHLAMQAHGNVWCSIGVANCLLQKRAFIRERHNASTARHVCLHVNKANQAFTITICESLLHVILVKATI